jgi:very-short-patch-repair endonuclease
MLVVEVDGRVTHGTRRAFQEDRDRDGRLAIAGYRVLRFTWWDVNRRPAVVADRVRRLLTSTS